MQSDEFPDTSAGGDPTVDDAGLGMLLAAAHQRCREAFNNGLGAAGVEARQFGVLRTLSRHGPTNQRHLLELLHVDKSAMVRIIDELERKGLAVRARDSHDRRAYAVDLTEDGRERLVVMDRIASDVGAELFSWLRPRERRQLVDLLDRLADRTTS